MNKKIFLGYCAFAPFVALAMACQAADWMNLHDTQDVLNFSFIVMLLTTPLCAWLYINSGHWGLAYIVADGHFVVLALPIFIPKSCYEFSVILSMLIVGYGLLLIWDRQPKPILVKKMSEPHFGSRPICTPKWGCPDLPDVDERLF